MSRLLASLAPRTKPAALATAVVSMVALGLLDSITGYEFSFALFYLLPVFLAAWFVGRGAGVAISVASAVTWQLSNLLAGEVFSHPVVPLWNATTRLGFFSVVTLLLVRLRGVLEHERAQSRTDFVTGAHNTRAFYDLVAQEAVRGQRHGRPFTVAYLDLDNFKAVNDRFGHEAGDNALRMVVRVAREAIRRVDAVARLGGDEFAILFPETDSQAVQGVLSRMREMVGEEMRRHGWPVTCSIGAVTCLSPPPSVDTVIRLADQLMLRAKQGGKDAVTYGHEAWGSTQQEELMHTCRLVVGYEREVPGSDVADPRLRCGKPAPVQLDGETWVCLEHAQEARRERRSHRAYT